MTELCKVCKLHYPIHLMTNAFLNGVYERMCPLCANDSINELHGNPKGTPFHGEIAESMRQEALEWNLKRT